MSGGTAWSQRAMSQPGMSRLQNTASKRRKSMTEDQKALAQYGMSRDQKRETMLQQLQDCQFYKTFQSKPKGDRKKGSFVPIMAYITEQAKDETDRTECFDIHGKK